jgi:hypothetical protein
MLDWLIKIRDWIGEVELLELIDRLRLRATATRLASDGQYWGPVA